MSILQGEVGDAVDPQCFAALQQVLENGLPE